MNIGYIFLGLVVLVFCLALGNATPELFSLSAGVEDLIRLGFLVLGIGALISGVVKGLD